MVFKCSVYTSDDPIMAVRLKAAGAASVMPAGSPIGSGQGILNPNNLRIILEYLKSDDPNYPVIIDAGVGTASDVSVAFELGADGVLLNTAIAHGTSSSPNGFGHETCYDGLVDWHICQVEYLANCTQPPVVPKKD